MTEESKSPVDKQVELLEELVKWTKVANYDKVKGVLERVLGKDNKRQAYMLTGMEKQETICTKAKISSKTLTALCKECVKLGLAVKEGNKYITLFDLKDFGLVPKEKKSGKDESKKRDR